MSHVVHKFTGETDFALELGNTIVVSEGDVIEHKFTDHSTIYFILVAEYPDIELIPVRAGTHLYTEHGPRTSYVRAI